jgi:hypothetical protein
LEIEGVLEVRSCPHGRGVFASRDFSAGDLIRSMSGVVFTTTPKSPPWKMWAMIVGRTADGRQLFWDEEDEGSAEYWSNFLDHGDEPNVRFSIDADSETARLCAVRAIRDGEELLLDYKEYDPGNWTPS